MWVGRPGRALDRVSVQPLLPTVNHDYFCCANRACIPHVGAELDSYRRP